MIGDRTSIRRLRHPVPDQGMPNGRNSPRRFFGMRTRRTAWPVGPRLQKLSKPPARAAIDRRTACQAAATTSARLSTVNSRNPGDPFAFDVTPSGVSELFPGLIGSRQSPSLFPCPLLSNSPSLHRHYPASSVLPPRPARPGSGSRVPRQRGFPCCAPYPQRARRNRRCPCRCSP